MIEVQNISKWYGDFQALKDVSFEVKKGEITGFLGPNGAGKTTMMKILTTFLFPDKGNGKVCEIGLDENPLTVRQKIGYLPEHTPLYEDMRVIDFLRFIAEARGVSNPKEKIKSTMKTCSIWDRRYDKIYTLSKGLRQRVGLAQALVHDPEVLILDEPTSGLDPNQIQDVRKVIREIGKDRTILLSTHILSEVEAMCNRVLIIHKGQLVVDKSMDEILQQSSPRYTVLFEGDGESIKEKLLKHPEIEDVNLDEQSNIGKKMTVIAKENAPHQGKTIYQAIQESNGCLLELVREKESLESLFIHVTAN
ncbi:MAG: ATP-binding cassette domain-containing protein [Planctomycetota bacterium]|nr:MAG: ATP-binding cassette domain-containing protein [Planctomycetota bacterium]